MTQGGGHAQYVVPSGLSYTRQLLPHAPYKDPEGALITAWRPGHWSNWGFEIGKSTGTAFRFARGGFQGVSCHDIAEVWVAFFSRYQRYRC